MNPNLPPLKDDTLQQLQELLNLQAATKAAEARGGNPVEIAALMTAASGDTPAEVVHGWKLYLPSFGALQVLDEIQSPIVIGGPVSFGQIAAVMVVLENQELAWKFLSGPNGVDAWNRHVWERTRHLTVPQANDIGRAAIKLVRRAMGAAEEDSQGNGAEGRPAASPAVPHLTPDGLPPSSSGLSANTISPSTTPSGNSPLNVAASSSTPDTNAPEENPPAPVRLIAPDSPPSAPAAAPGPIVRRVKVCGVDCHPGEAGCNGYCRGLCAVPPLADA